MSLQGQDRKSESTPQSIEAITVRKIVWPFPEHTDPLFIKGHPEESFIYVGFSCLFPYLEPYLIRSMWEAKKRLTDKDLIASLEGFCAQENQHFRQHARFNRTLGLGEISALNTLENEIQSDYKRLSETRSLAFNLAYAEGFEAFTLAITRFVIETGELERVEWPVRDLFRWHFLEELEHRLVAFDVYQNIHGGYFYRTLISLYAHWHLCRFVLRVVSHMRLRDPLAFRQAYGGPWAMLWRLQPFLRRVFLRLLPKILWTYTPWYTPHKIPMPDEVKAWSAEYSRMPEDRLTHTKENS
jgi:uncharacterized protein